MRNVFVPINSLPDEILSTVFSFTQAADATVSGRPMQVATRLSSVCERWRNVAISDALMWSEMLVPMSSHAFEQFSEYLARSKGSPISIEFGDAHVLFDVSSDIARILCEKSHRFKKLVLNTLSTDSVDIEHYEMACPILEHLTVYCRFDGLDPFPLLFHNQLPALRTLEVNLSNELPTPVFPNLTSLILRNYHPKTSLLAFLDMLEGVPLLEFMQIVGDGPLEDEDPPLSRVVKLSKLSSLKLEACNSRLILSYLHLSPLDIVIDDYLAFAQMEEGAGENLLQAIPLDCSHLGAMSYPDTLHLALEGACLYTEITTITGNHCCITDKASTIVALLEIPAMMIPTLSSLRAREMFRNLRKLSISNTEGTPSYPVIPDEEWVRLLHHLHNLQHLSVQCFQPEGLTRALMSHHDVTNLLAVRQLKTLDWEPWKTSEVADQAGWLDDWDRAIEYRGAQAAPIIQVRIGLYSEARHDLLSWDIEHHVSTWIDAGVEVLHIKIGDEFVKKDGLLYLSVSCYLLTLLFLGVFEE